MWFSTVATSFQLPIHMSAEHAGSNPKVCVIRLSRMEHPPAGVGSTRIGEATLVYTPGRNLLLVSDNSSALLRAVQSLSSRDTFPRGALPSGR